MNWTKTSNYQWTPGGVTLFSDPASLRIEFAADGILRMWTTLKGDFCQDETLVVEKKAFPHPHVRTAEYGDRITEDRKPIEDIVYSVN